MILVDTSTWIDFFAGRHTKQTGFLRTSIEESEDFCVCGLIMTEVLQGIRADTEFDRIKAILGGLIYLPITKSMFLKSADMYRAIRKRGRTIRSPVDCMIASICLEHEVSLLHNDKDFEVVGEIFPLKTAG